MAHKEVGALTVGTKPDGTEIIHVVQGGNSRQLTTRQLAEIGSGVITDSTTARTAVIGDSGKHIRFSNAGTIAYTINTSVFTAGDEILVEQAGAGVVTITAGAGFTLNSRGALVDTNGTFAVAGIRFISATEATLFGDLA